MRRIVGILAALTACAAAVFAQPALAKRSPAAGTATVKLISSSERSAIRSGRVRVLVRYRQAGRVRILARLSRGGRGRPPVRFGASRLLVFRKPGRRRVWLRLTGRGLAALRAQLRACTHARLALIARARGTRAPRDRWSKRDGSLPAGGSCSRRGAGGGVPGGGTSGQPGGSGGGEPQGVGTGAGGGSIRAGAASSDITPPVGTPMFAYTARSNLANPPTNLEKALALAGGDRAPDANLYAKTFKPSEGIHTRVRARAIVIEQAGRKYALVQADLGGLPFALTQEVLKRVADTGVTGERLLLSATHTHSSTGPIWPADSAGYAALGGDLFEPRIFDITAEGIAEAIRAASARLEPARLGTGSAPLTDASRNREFDVYKLNPETPKNDAAARAASIDSTVNVVRVDALDGRPLGVWSNFAIHPTSFGDDNLLFSGDNAASAERIVEAETGGAINVWTNSNEGDISPNGDPAKDGSDPLEYAPNAFASANLAGQRTAKGIVAAWRDAGGKMDADAQLDARRTIMAFDGITQADGRFTGPQPVLGLGVVSERQCNPLGDPGPPEAQGKKQPLAGGPLLPNTAPVSVWRIGPLGVVAVPSEITKTQGERIKRRLLDDAGGRIGRFALAGLTNAYNSYTATPEEYDACSYEGSFTLFGRHQGPRYRDVASTVLGALLGGTEPWSLPEPPPTGLNATQPTVAETPDAGQTTAEPTAAPVRRYGRAVFKWKAGDPAVDAPRGKTFVQLQRRVGADWQTVGTDDGFLDTTRYDKTAKEWTETWQFGACDPLGSYRFVVTGQRKKNGSVGPYEATSSEFQLEGMPALSVDPVTVSGGTGSVLARYPDPGAGVLLALPRRVRAGTATLSVTPPGGVPAEVTAHPDSERLRFTAPVTPGSSVSVVGVNDACGNSGP